MVHRAQLDCSITHQRLPVIQSISIGAQHDCSITHLTPQDRVEALHRAGRGVLAALTRLADCWPGPPPSSSFAGRVGYPGPTLPGGPEPGPYGQANSDVARGGGVPAELLRRLVRAVGPALTGTGSGPVLRMRLEQARSALEGGGVGEGGRWAVVMSEAWRR
jgi:hypothetical protein